MNQNEAKAAFTALHAAHGALANAIYLPAELFTSEKVIAAFNGLGNPLVDFANSVDPVSAAGAAGAPAKRPDAVPAALGGKPVVPASRGPGYPPKVNPAPACPALDRSR